MSISSHLPSERKQAFSLFGQQLAGGSGIEELMDDLGHALAEGGEHMLMLGGGNPAHLPGVEKVWQARLQEIVQDEHRLRRVLNTYDPPRGHTQFLQSLARMLAKEYGWPVGPENIAVTSGGQMAFFFLFNLLAGPHASGPARRILFPLMPEYIGYAAQGVTPGMLHGVRPTVKRLARHAFEYHVDFSALPLDESVAALCVSRPTNPSGNVLRDDEMARLSTLAAQWGIPFIIDNAYGLPFPGILFRDANPQWAPHHIFVFSLSKLGLPGTRTAFVVGPPEIIRAVRSLTAVTGLANGTLGQAITHPLLEDGTLLRLAREEIRPFYQKKMEQARAWVAEFFPPESNYALHETQGAMFLWLWLENCPCTSRELYHRLKARGVLVVPGDPFFFGLPPEDDSWPHRHECLRLNFAMSDEVVREGLRRIGEEITLVYRS
jgi:valine--pyruvate aminotransferase